MPSHPTGPSGNRVGTTSRAQAPEDLTDRQATTKTLKTFAPRTREQWRQWLAKHHDSEPEVWLVFDKRLTGRRSVSYEDAVAEALCFGWVDSLIKRLDDARYARKFTPRKPYSRWSSANRRRYTDLQARGLLAPAGLKRAPTARSGDAPRPPGAVPRYVEQALKADPAAWVFFEGLAPSYRRAYVAWIDSARRQDTKERRLREAVGLLSAGRKLGLK
jgi:uncharacterized protein YdeI (YjbR/CyaY-like superfamily)